jgi:uncharacterized protein (TIGR02145 family)
MKTKHFSRLPLLLFAAALAFTASLSAQVTIGDEALPRRGALLDLKKTNGTAYIGSLLLPNVELPGMDSIPLGFTEGISMSAEDRDKNSELAGSIVYNTLAETGEGIYLWDGDTWTRINLGGSVVIKSDPGNSSECDPFKADGNCENAYEVTDPACRQVGEFIFTWIAGESFIERLTVIDPGAGKFSVKFRPNDRASERQAILLVTSPCGNSNTFIFKQKGDNTGCGEEEVPAVGSYNGTAMCIGGAVYLYITGFTGSDASKLIWTLNGQEVKRGLTCVATAPGNYIVYNGKIGCEKKSEIQVTLNGGDTAPAPVEFIVIGNEGIACGAGETVELIVTKPVSGTIVWYRDGNKAAKGTNESDDYTEETNGDPSHIHAKSGSWQAVVEDGTCSSLPVSANVTENASSDEDYTPVMKINGQQNSYTLCQNGSMYLEIDNPRTDYTHTWYIDNTQVGTGTAGVYATVPPAGKVVLRLRAVPTSGSSCAREALAATTVETDTPPTVPYITVAATGNVLCGGQATLIANTNSGTTYRWFHNDTEISGTDATLTVTSVGTYTVTATSSEGCVSKKSAGKEIIASDYATVEWAGIGSHPDEAKDGETKTYSVSVDFPVGAIYTWTIIHKEGTSGIITNGQGTPSITVSFPTAGVDTVQCAVTTSCGNAIGSPITQEITVTEGCKDAVITGTSALTVNVKAGQTAPVVLSVNALGKPLTYQWYKAESGTESNPVGTGSTYTLPSEDIETKGTSSSYWCRVSADTCGYADSQTFTVNVEADPAQLIPGSGHFFGKTCFDIANANSDNICGELSGRSSQKTIFSNRTPQESTVTSNYSGVQIYTFTPTNAVSHVRFFYTEPSGISIVDSIVPQSLTYGNGDGISSSCKLTVYYSKDLDENLKGLSRLTTPYKLKLYAVYSSDANYSNAANDKMLVLNITLQDCACCGAYTDAGKTQWLNFMCHNLGADESLNPFEPRAEIHGAKYKFGAKEATLSQSADQSSAAAVTNWNNTTYYPCQTSGNWLPENDPCPSGWRLPVKEEWENVVKYNTWVAVGTWPGYSAGMKVGDALFFPIAGYRQETDGRLFSVGQQGYYWCSTAYYSNGGYSLDINSSGGTRNSRAFKEAFCVRCVAE